MYKFTRVNKHRFKNDNIFHFLKKEQITINKFVH